MQVPKVNITSIEQTTNLSIQTTKQILTALQTNGVCILENLVDSETANTNYNKCIQEWNDITTAQAGLQELYEGIFQNVVPRYSELAPRGPKRYSISTFHSPKLRANAILSNIMTQALSMGGKSSCFSEETVISLPGSDEQRVHVDAGHLYDPYETKPLPCYHYSCFIALCDQTGETGNTCFSLGSHLTHGGGHESKEYWNYVSCKNTKEVVFLSF